MVETAASSRRAARLWRVARLGLPFVLGAVAINLSGIIDTAMMGRYGEDELAAVAGSAAVFDVFSNLLLAAAVGYQILAARFIGAEDPGALRASLRSSLVLVGGLSIVLITVIAVAPEWLAGLVVDEPQLREIGGGYMLARSPSLLAIVLFALLAASLNSYERPRYAVGATLTATGVNLVFDLLLIYGLGPFPELGAVGNGLATTIAWLVAAFYMLVASASFGLPGLLRREPRHTDYDFETSVYTLSWPAMVSALLDHVSIAIFFAIIGTIGQAELGGARIAFELMVFMFAFMSAFSAASRILIGRSLGAADAGATRSFWRVGQVTLLAPGCLAAIAFVGFRTPIAFLFTGFEPVVAAAGSAIAIVGVCLPLMGLTLGSASMLLAAGRTRWNMYANLGPALLVQLPISWFLVQSGLGIVGAFGGVVAYWLVRLGLTETLAHVTYRQEIGGSDADGASKIRIQET